VNRALSDTHSSSFLRPRDTTLSTFLCCLGKTVTTKETGFQVQLFNMALIQFPLVNLNIVGMDLLCWMEPKGTVTFPMKTSAFAILIGEIERRGISTYSFCVHSTFVMML
jgi:hypothetical protein